MRTARFLLVPAGILATTFGAIYLFVPRIVLDEMGFGALSPEALTDIRATYGGLQLGFGAFLLWTVRERSRYRAGVMSLALVFPCLAASRAIGLLVDGEPTVPLLAALAFEAVVSVIALAVLSKLTPDLRT